MILGLHRGAVSIDEMNKNGEESLDRDDVIFSSRCLVKPKVTLLEGRYYRLRDVGCERGHDTKKNNASAVCVSKLSSCSS